MVKIRDDFCRNDHKIITPFPNLAKTLYKTTSWFIISDLLRVKSWGKDKESLFIIFKWGCLKFKIYISQSKQKQHGLTWTTRQATQLKKCRA